MRFVERAEIRPHHCAVFPQLGASQREGFIDTGAEMPGFDNHVYVGVPALREMCKFMGWPTPESHAELVEQRDNLLSSVADLQEQLQDAHCELDAIHVMRSRGWTPARKPGPKKQRSEEVAVDG